MDKQNIFDVIIIGAGSIGTPTAFYLSKAGLKVLVVDQSPSVGQGSNKRAIGGVRATHSDRAKIQLCKRSLEIFSNWKAEYGQDIEWFQGGYCFVAYRDEQKKILLELLETQKGYGLNIDWLDKVQLMDLIPDLNPIELLGGTFSPNDGSISPLLAVHAFYVQASHLGAVFRFNESVQQIITTNSLVRGILTNQASYEAPVVINAAGPWAHEVASLAGLDIPVRPDSHEAAITEAVAHFLWPMIVDIRPTPGSTNYYFYQHLTGQIIFCITPSPSIWGTDVRETSSFLPMVARRMVDLMPRLANIRVRRTWRGLYPMTPDGSPLVGWAENPKGLLTVAGMCGQGLMLGPGIAELVTRIVTHSLVSEDHEILNDLSPTRQFTSLEALK